jgi:hypothetical protein
MKKQTSKRNISKNYKKFLQIKPRKTKIKKDLFGKIPCLEIKLEDSSLLYLKYSVRKEEASTKQELIKIKSKDYSFTKFLF